MDERIKKAFDFSADLTKQLITLATGIITLTIAFKKDFFPNPNTMPTWLAYCTWYAFLASIAMGILTLSALTGTLDAKDKEKELTIYSPNIVVFSILQFLTFGTGLFFTIYFAARGL
jgi:hypothetical protein